LGQKNQDAYQKARSVLHERYGNYNVVSTAFINKLEKQPKIRTKDASALREFSEMLDKVLGNGFMITVTNIEMYLV